MADVDDPIDACWSDLGVVGPSVTPPKQKRVRARFANESSLDLGNLDLSNLELPRPRITRARPPSNRDWVSGRQLDEAIINRARPVYEPTMQEISAICRWADLRPLTEAQRGVVEGLLRSQHAGSLNLDRLGRAWVRRVVEAAEQRASDEPRDGLASFLASDEGLNALLANTSTRQEAVAAAQLFLAPLQRPTLNEIYPTGTTIDDNDQLLGEGIEF